MRRWQAATGRVGKKVVLSIEECMCKGPEARKSLACGETKSRYVATA